MAPQKSKSTRKLRAAVKAYADDKEIEVNEIDVDELATEDPEIGRLKVC